MSNTITVYSKPGCVQCVATYRKLDRHNVEYDRVPDVTVNVDLVESIRARARELTVAGGMPYVTVYNESNELIADWFGFNPDNLDQYAIGRAAA